MKIQNPEISSRLLSCMHFMQYMATIPVQSDIETEMVQGAMKFFNAEAARFYFFYPGNNPSIIIHAYQPDEIPALPSSLMKVASDVGASGFPAVERVDSNVWVLLPVSVGYKVKGVWMISIFSPADLSKDLIDGMLTVVSFIGTLLSRKETDLALIASAEQYQLVADYTYDWEFWITSEGKFTYCSPSCERITGYTKEEFLSKQGLLIQLIHPEDTNLFTSHQEETHHLGLDTGPWNIEFRIIRKDGEVRWIHHICLPIFNRQGEYLGQRGSNRDITDKKTAEETLKEYHLHLEEMVRTRTVALEEEIKERKKAELTLKENEEKFISIFEETPDPIMILNSAYRILEVNRGFENVFECSNEKICNVTIDDVGIQLTRSLIKQILEEIDPHESIYHHESILKTESSGPFIADIAISRIIINSEPCLLVQIHDIDEIRRAHEAVSQINHKLKILSSITRHDILNRTMVTTFYSEMLREEVADEKMKERLDAIWQSSKEIQTLIEFTGQYQDLGVEAPAWQQVEHILHHRIIGSLLGNVLIHSDLGHLEIYADRMLEKVVYNLVDNSMRHGKGLTYIRLSCHEELGDMILWYEDDGGGIPENEKEKSFEKGFGKNTGLGLFLIREILSITGISIRENGIPGEGVRFEIRVPAGKFRNTNKSHPDII